MIKRIKQLLYFPIAYYFRFWAKIQLSLWKPKTIVVTGSSGKTTLLHLIESQIGEKAKYSHRANSSYGIPFDILGLKRETLMFYEWIYLFIAAPFIWLSRDKPVEWLSKVRDRLIYGRQRKNGQQSNLLPKN